MPELPEVELVVRDLRHILHPPLSLTHIEIFCPKVLLDHKGAYIECSKSSLGNLACLIGAELHEITRMGKYIFFHFRNGFQSPILQCHLRMTGRFIPLDRVDKPPQPYERIRLIFTKNGEKRALSFSDVRRFGRFTLIPSQEAVSLSLGLEPFDDRFVPYFWKELQKRKKAPIKAILLDQEAVAGVGNIYADEALFLAQISPFRAGVSLSQEEIQRLKEALIELFHRSIEKGGSTLGYGVGNFSSPFAVRGEFQDHFNVYHKTLKPCPRCATPIQRVVIRGRSTHFCPSCQK